MAFQTFTPEQSLLKIKQYCAYQERCHSEVRDKLYSFGLHQNEVDEIISTLITENYLNEERFAVHFAGGKFRMKQWGKIKIRQALKNKQVSEYCSRKALKEIDNNEYRQAFFKLAEQKLKTLKTEKNIFIKKRKLQDFLLQKGYEREMITDAVKNMIAKR
ncbi:RecX family transcriptional regulator [Hanamia caeni]|jgi:regulatory protein|uniref:Regulatory protein RecX n=1 Tax=Hanamia caeni TaxID=2294116 RepID=A0A3M9NPB2_9BACT|nr:regulatory protein RecX [Hanamia caeni]RNI39013.1 RecX family transcriptional regulator [Hanamia caeni]